jgi:hypothetical protein
MLKRYIIIAALACTVSGVAKQITSLSDLSNNSVVTIARIPVEADSCGYLTYAPGEADAVDYTLQVQQAESVADNQRWVVYHQAVDDAYYLYNLGSQRCVNVGTSNCQLSETATNVKLQYLQNKNAWLISGNDYMLGLSKGQRAAAYFLGDMTGDNYGFLFTIAEDDARTLTDSEVLTMQEVISGTRRAEVEAYRAFAEMARNVNADGKDNYCGSYAIDELYNALKDNDGSKVSLTELARMKEEAIKASFPSPTAYYRIKNAVRPTNGSLNNYMTLQKTGDKLFCQNSTELGLSNLNNNGENLRLFQFESVDGLNYDRARLRVCAVDKGLQVGNKDFVVTFLDNDEAKVFQLVRKADDSRLFMLQYNGENKRLTTNGVNGGQAIAINTIVEDAMSWYIEKVETFSGSILTNGAAAMTLPCAVYVPDDCRAYYVSSVDADGVKVTAINDVVPAYTPFILEGEKGSTPTFTIAEVSATSVSDNKLSGNTYYKENTDDLYVLSVDASGNDVFVRQSGITELTANSAYIVAGNLTASTLSVSVDNKAAGVNDVINDAAPTTYYDLNGRAVANPSRGTIVIDNKGNKTKR